MATQNMKTYETVCLTKIDMPEDKFTALMERAKNAILNDGKGEWLTTDDWGKAKISFAIGKENRARWTYMRYKSAAAGVDELRRGLSINEFVLRQQTVKTREDGSDYETLKATMATDIADRDRPPAWRDERSRDRGGFRDRGDRGPRRDFNNEGGDAGFEGAEGGEE